jgi:hypothetical protein
MSIVGPEVSGSPSSPLIYPENLVFDYPEADVILRSCDFVEFRVLKLYILHSSPILSEKVSITSDRQSCATAIIADFASGANVPSLPVIKLPDSGAILFSLLSYIFPVPPILPATVEQTMELLSVAQKYKMDAILTHIRNHIAQQDPPFIREDTALYVYSLAQKYGLRKEALQAARSTLTFSPLTIESLDSEDNLDVMPGACLHELWNYHERVKSNLTSDLEEFRKNSSAKKALGDSNCHSLMASRIPTWLDRYIESIGRDPALFDPIEFYRALENHARDGARRGCASCAGMSRKQTRSFWAALATVAHASIAKVGH